MYFSFQNQPRAFTIHKKASYLTFEPHVHSHIEFVFMQKGGKTIGFADEKELVIEQGDLFVAFPNQVHYYQDIEKPLEATLLIASPDICPEYKKYLENLLPETPVLKNAANNPRIKNVITILQNCDYENNDFAEAQLRGCMLILLGEFLNCTNLQKIPTNNTDVTKDIITFCNENYMNDISLATISDSLHISRYYVSHIFAKRLHISFSDYINSLRVRKACELLKSGKGSITEIAFAVGYNSARTFDRCFSKIKDVTPREYRANALKKNKK